MTYYAILSEAGCIEVFPDYFTRSEILQYYYYIEFESKRIDIPAESPEEMEAWVEREYPGISLEFTDPKITFLQLQNHELRKRVDELDEVVGRLEEACQFFVTVF